MAARHYGMDWLRNGALGLLIFDHVGMFFVHWDWRVKTAHPVVADRFWNRDHPLRATLTETVFPFSIIHQTIIVLVGWYLLQFGLSPLLEFPILVVTTAAGCWLFYSVGRRTGWMRPLIGFKRNGPQPAGARTAAAPAA